MGLCNFSLKGILKLYIYRNKGNSIVYEISISKGVVILPNKGKEGKNDNQIPNFKDKINGFLVLLDAVVKTV